MPRPLGGSPHGCPALWSISHHRVLLPRVYGTTASALWLELRGPSAWQATPSWTVYRLACHELLPWLWVTFATVPDAAWPGSNQRLGVLRLPLAWWVGWVAPVRPTPGVLFAVFCPSAALRARCPAPLGFCSPVCTLGALCYVCGVLGHFTPVHRYPRSVRCVACPMPWATWLRFSGVLAWCLLLRVCCPGPLGSCARVCPLWVLCYLCGVLGHLAPVHQCAPSVCCVACAVSWATWLLFTGAHARCVVLCVCCCGQLGSCSAVCKFLVVSCACDFLGHWAPFHQCARSVRCLACAVTWATWLLFTGVPAHGVVSRAQCPGRVGSCSTMCQFGVLYGVCGVLGHLAPVHRCARSAWCVASAVSWATWLLFTSVLARRVVLCVRRPGRLGSFSSMCPVGALCCACSVAGHSAPVHRCDLSACRVACAVSWATWLLFTDVSARCVALRERCPRPLGSC